MCSPVFLQHITIFFVDLYFLSVLVDFVPFFVWKLSKNCQKFVEFSTFIALFIFLAQNIGCHPIIEIMQENWNNSSIQVGENNKVYCFRAKVGKSLCSFFEIMQTIFRAIPSVTYLKMFVSMYFALGNLRFFFSERTWYIVTWDCFDIIIICTNF